MHEHMNICQKSQRMRVPNQTEAERELEGEGRNGWLDRRRLRGEERGWVPRVSVLVCSKQVFGSVKDSNITTG